MIDKIENNNVPLPEMHEKLKEDYVCYVRYLGSGSFTNVFSIRHKNGERYAIKEAVLYSDRESIMEEVRVMEGINHPNIIPLMEILELDNKVCLIMELAEGNNYFL